MSVGDNAPAQAGLSAVASRIWPGALWLTLAVVAGIAMFWPGVVNLWAAWQAPEYSHGPLIPVISGYLFLRQLKTVAPHDGPVTDRWPGLLILGLAMMIGLVGITAEIDKFVAGAIIIWTGGLVVVSFGWARGWQFWPPVLHLGFMMPLPFFLYWEVSLLLQGISSQLGVWFITLMNIPVYLDGNIIDLGVWKLHVAEACSGLRYLFPVFSFTYIFAVLYQGSFWHKAILLLAAAPITIFMNSVRVGIIGIMVDSYGIEMAEGFLHLFEGWVIFIICILMMIGLARVMQLLSGDRRSLAEVLDVDTSGLGAQMLRVGDIRLSGAWAAAIGAFALAAVAWAPLTKSEAPPVPREPFVLFPETAGEWSVAQRRTLPEEISEVLRAGDYLSVALASRQQAAPVDLFVAYYPNLTVSQIHSPEVCIPAGGWEMSDIEPYELSIPVGDGAATIPVNRAIIQKGLERQLVYYWFDQSGGRRVTSDLMAKFWVVYDGATTGRLDGALVRYITPIGQHESMAEADSRLTAAVADSLPLMPRFIGTTLAPDAR